MPSKKNQPAELPAIPTELIDQFVTGPMSAEAVQTASMAFKKALIERALGAEMSHHLGYPPGAAKPEESVNHRNGRSAKTVLTDDGPLRIEVPRDRAGSFEPVLIPKHERRFTGFDDKIVAMYARGMTVRDIQHHLEKTIGTDLMPAVDVAAKGATVLSTALGALPGPLVTVGTVVVGGAAAWTIFGSTVIGTVGTLGNMIGVLATYTPSAIVARGATAGLAEAFAVEAAAAEGAAGSTATAGAAARGGAGSMAGMAGKAALVGAALYGVGAAANWIGDKFADAVPDAESMNTALIHLARSGKEAGAIDKAGGIDKLTDRMRRFKDETKGVNNVANKAVEGIVKIGTLGKGTTGMDRLTAQINAYDKSLAAMVSGGKGKEAAADFKLIQAQAKEAGLSTKDVNRFMNDYVKAVADAKLKNADAKGAADGLSGSLKKQKDKTDKAKQAMNDLTSALKAYSDQSTSILSANINWEAALDSVTSTLQTNGNQWDINTEAGRNNMNALIGAKDAAIDNANAMLTNGSSVDQVTSSMSLFRGQLENTLSQAGLTKDQIKFLIDQMGLTPSQIHTTITSNLPDAQRQAQNYLDALNALPTTKRIAVEEVFNGSSSFFGHAPGQWWGGDLPGHAWGGSPAGWAMVGEHGPELTNGKTVIGAGRTQSLLSRMPSAPVAVSGGNTYVTIQVQGSVVTERDLVTQVINGVNAKQRRSPRNVLVGAS